MSIIVVYFIIFAVIVGFYLLGIKKNRKNWVFFDQIVTYLGLGFIILPQHYTEDPLWIWSFFGVGFIVTFFGSFVGHQYRKKIGMG